MTPTRLHIELVAMGLSSTQAATELGCSPRTMRRWIEGHRDIPNWVPRMLQLVRELQEARTALVLTAVQGSTTDRHD